VQDHGGYFENPSLGAPFDQELYDYAIGTDRLNLDLAACLAPSAPARALPGAPRRRPASCHRADAHPPDKLPRWHDAI
jgi:hypothetical protein